MTLVCMINADEEALICDLAETYHIYDYKTLPCKTVAILANGLRTDSRIAMTIAKTKAPIPELLLAAIADNTRMLGWLQSADGAKGVNKPASILQMLMSVTQESEIEIYETGAEFDAEWKRLTGGEGDGDRISKGVCTNHTVGKRDCERHLG